MGDLVSIIESAYRVEQDEGAWLTGVVEAAAPVIDRGSGVIAYFADCSISCETSGYFATPGTFEGHRALWDRYEAHVSKAVRRNTHLAGPVYSGPLPPDVQEIFRWLQSQHGSLRAVTSINAFDATGKGCVLCAFETDRAGAAPDADTESFARLSAHMAAGLRLRARLALAPPLLSAPEAVFDPGGKIVHAEGKARTALARDALRDAVVTTDRARTRGARMRQAEAVAAWQGLVQGRWSLVEVFDGDGRRYVVAAPNEPTPHPTRALSRREHQVAAAAALGHANKLIAYELGLQPSTVARFLARARAKLGARTRVDLIARLEALHTSAGERTDAT
jgi:DNA-binding CsgD family transcriptional regulator